MNEPGEQRPKVDLDKTRQLEADTGMLVDKPPTLPHLPITENSPPYVPIKEDDSPLPTEQREAAEKKAEEEFNREQKFRAMREAIDGETVVAEGVLAERAIELYNAHKEKGDLADCLDDIGQQDNSRYKYKIKYGSNGRKEKSRYKDPTSFVSRLRKNKEYKTFYHFRSHMLDKYGAPAYSFTMNSAIKDKGGEAQSAKLEYLWLSLGRAEDYPGNHDATPFGGSPKLHLWFRAGKIDHLTLGLSNHEEERQRAQNGDPQEPATRAAKLIQRYGEGQSIHLDMSDRKSPRLSISGKNYKLDENGELVVSEYLREGKYGGEWSSPYKAEGVSSSIIPDTLRDVLSLIPIKDLYGGDDKELPGVIADSEGNSDSEMQDTQNDKEKMRVKVIDANGTSYQDVSVGAEEDDKPDGEDKSSASNGLSIA